MEWRAGGDKSRLTLLLQLGLPGLQQASDQFWADDMEESVHCFLGPLVLIEHVAELLAPIGGIWGWHPRHSLETQDILSLKCCT